MTAEITAITTAEARHHALIDLLATGMSPEEAAIALGVSWRTVRRDLARPAVAAAIRAAHRQRLHALLETALAAAPDALRTLRTVAADLTVAEHARVAAARALLDHAHRLYDAADLDERLERLETRVADQ